MKPSIEHARMMVHDTWEYIQDVIGRPADDEQSKSNKQATLDSAYAVYERWKSFLKENKELDFSVTLTTEFQLTREEINLLRLRIKQAVVNSLENFNVNVTVAGE